MKKIFDFFKHFDAKDWRAFIGICFIAISLLTIIIAGFYWLWTSKLTLPPKIIITGIVTFIFGSMLFKTGEYY